LNLCLLMAFLHSFFFHDNIFHDLYYRWSLLNDFWDYSMLGHLSAFHHNSLWGWMVVNIL
jgi:hypothetical protein